MIAMCSGAAPGSATVPDQSATSRRIAAMRWSAKLKPIQTTGPPSTSRPSTRLSLPS